MIKPAFGVARRMEIGPMLCGSFHSPARPMRRST
jgi:hypothetical protein